MKLVKRVKNATTFVNRKMYSVRIFISIHLAVHFYPPFKQENDMFAPLNLSTASETGAFLWSSSEATKHSHTTNRLPQGSS